jgi:hypothetical protein
VIAGTSSGKTMPFMMLLLMDPEKDYHHLATQGFAIRSSM